MGRTARILHQLMNPPCCCCMCFHCYEVLYGMTPLCIVFIHSTLMDTCCFANWLPYREGKERWKKEAAHTRFVGDKFHKLGDLGMRLVLGSSKISRFQHPPVRVLKVCIKVLTKFGHLLSPDGLNNTFLSQGYVLETAASMRIVRGTYISRTGKQVRSL